MDNINVCIQNTVGNLMAYYTRSVHSGKSGVSSVLNWGICCNCKLKDQVSPGIELENNEFQRMLFLAYAITTKYSECGKMRSFPINVNSTKYNFYQKTHKRAGNMGIYQLDALDNVSPVILDYNNDSSIARVNNLLCSYFKMKHAVLNGQISQHMVSIGWLNYQLSLPIRLILDLVIGPLLTVGYLHNSLVNPSLVLSTIDKLTIVENIQLILRRLLDMHNDCTKQSRILKLREQLRGDLICIWWAVIASMYRKYSKHSHSSLCILENLLNYDNASLNIIKETVHNLELFHVEYLILSLPIWCEIEDIIVSPFHSYTSE